MGKGGHPMGLRPVPTFKAQHVWGSTQQDLRTDGVGGAEQRGQEEPHVNNSGDAVPRNPKMLCCGMPVLRIRWVRQGGKPRLGTEPFPSLEPSIATAVAAHTGLHVGYSEAA